MHLLITGGAGFIGSNLARCSLSTVSDLTIVDDFSTGYAENLADLDIRVVHTSVVDASAMRKAMNGVDAVIHLAALGSVPRSIEDPAATHLANATGTLSVLDSARQADVGHVVVASSSSVYGMNPSLLKRERDWIRPMSPYAVSKLATEQYALAFQQSYGLATLAFRFFNVYGPGQRAGHAYAAVIPTFIDAVLAGRSLVINGDGRHSRDFTFVTSVCRVLLDAVRRRVTHSLPVNLAFGTHVTLTELVDMLGDVTNSRPSVCHGPARAGDVVASSADTTLLRSLFPSAEPVHLRDGLGETVAWFRDLPGGRAPEVTSR